MNFFEVENKVKDYLNNNNCVLIYAFNATGKTRLSNNLSKTQYDENDEIKVLCYNAFLEDDFTWDNDNLVFRYSQSEITQYIYDEGLDGEIIELFKMTTGVNIEPQFDFKNQTIEFNIPTGDDSSKCNIKISKGEETIFKWVLFLTVLKNAITTLKDSIEDRSTTIFNNLNYVIIDDPVSSIDDYRIYTIACQLIEIIKELNKYNSNTERKVNVSFLITTHHALFYNLLYNSFKNKHTCNLVMMKRQNDYSIKNVKNNSLFSYHGAVITELNQAIMSGSLQKKHFNLFRSILEKTSVFLGYEQWDSLFYDYSDYERIKRALNMNSHGRIIEYEINDLEQEQISIFSNAFHWFLKEYHFYISN